MPRQVRVGGEVARRVGAQGVPHGSEHDRGVVVQLAILVRGDRPAQGDVFAVGDRVQHVEVVLQPLVEGLAPYPHAQPVAEPEDRVGQAAIDELHVAVIHELHARRGGAEVAGLELQLVHEAVVDPGLAQHAVVPVGRVLLELEDVRQVGAVDAAADPEPRPLQVETGAIAARGPAAGGEIPVVPARVVVRPTKLQQAVEDHLELVVAAPDEETAVVAGLDRRGHQALAKLLLAEHGADLLLHFLAASRIDVRLGHGHDLLLQPLNLLLLRGQRGLQACRALFVGRFRPRRAVLGRRRRREECGDARNGYVRSTPEAVFVHASLTCSENKLREAISSLATRPRSHRHTSLAASSLARCGCGDQLV